MNRLNTICSMISNKDNKVIDIGTDHAYTIIELFKKHKANKAIGVDINEMPLERAKNNLIKHEMINDVELVLSNGFDNVLLNNTIDYCVISGMGSNSIIKIMESPKSKKIKEFVLQPNNKNYLLRGWLSKNNYKIIKEKISYENNIYYEVLLVKSGKTNILTDKDIYLGPIFKKNKTKLYNDYINENKKYLKSIINKTSNNNLKKQYKVLNDNK